jgi:hypothetical protein
VDAIQVGQDWSGSVVGEPCEGVGDTLRTGVTCPDAIAAVMVEGGTQVPSMDGMGSPGAPGRGFFMDEDPDARRCKRGTVKVENATDMGIGGEVGMEPAGAQEVEGLESLGQKSIPEMEGEVRWGGTQSGNEVVLKGADGALSGIPAMDVGRSELGIDVVFVEISEKGSGGLIVETL